MLGGVGCELSLVCMVMGFPQPEVSWYKETMILAPSSNSLIGATGMRHSLLIPELGEEDFANYSCVAYNDLGRARAHFSITGNGMSKYYVRHQGSNFFFKEGVL